jgi:hypothetical protein
MSIQPCGTRSAYRRHRAKGETACKPCITANTAYSANERLKKGIPPRATLTTETLITEIEHLTGLGQGTDYILKAIGYVGREKQLRDRLQKHKRVDLFYKVCSEEYWLAA